MTRTQKRWAVGGGIGAVAAFLGYEWWKHRDHRGHAGGHAKHHGHHHGEPGTALATEDSYERGEYGKKHGHHHHKERDHGEQ